MKIQLYDGLNIELPMLKTFEERVKYVNDKIFEGNYYENSAEEQSNALKYKSYYNICSTDLSSSVVKDIERWWLGVRKVNNPIPIENIKKTLDRLTGYIIGGKDLSMKHIKKKKQLIDDLKDKVIYEDKDYIFLVNDEMETQLAKTLSLLENKKYPNFTDEYMIKDIKTRLNNCKITKEKAKDIKTTLLLLKQEKYELIDTFQEEYKLFQSEKSKDGLDFILRLANKIKDVNQEIKFYKIQMHEEYENYLLCTEFFYKTK